MEEQSYAKAGQPSSELDMLFAELSRTHEYISVLEARLSPVIRKGLKGDATSLIGGTPTVENHIVTAVASANQAANRLISIIDSLAI